MSFTVRPAVPEDFKQILSWDARRVAELTPRPNILDDAVVQYDDGIAAYGAIKLFAEAVLSVNHNMSKQAQGAAFSQLMRLAIGACVHKNIEQLHVFTSSPDFESVLKKHFGFEPIKESGLVLCTRV